MHEDVCPMCGGGLKRPGNCPACGEPPQAMPGKQRRGLPRLPPIESFILLPIALGILAIISLLPLIAWIRGLFRP